MTMILYAGFELASRAKKITLHVRPRGRCGNPKLTEEKVRAIRADTRTCRAVATEFGITYTQVHRVRTGECWGWVK